MATKKIVKKPKVAPKPPTSSQRLDAIGIDVICKHVTSGESLQSFCTAHGFSPVSVLRWIDADKDRAEDYAHARIVRADLVFDSLDDVSEQAVTAENAVVVAGLRLKADNIKWKLARMNAKKYGDKTTVSGDADNPLKVDVSLAVSFVKPGV